MSHWQVGGNDRAPAAATGAVHAGDVVKLTDVQVRRVDRRDRARVVEERVRIARFGTEPELIGDVFDGVAVVVDHDFVQHVVVELEEVRTTIGRLKRDEVGDQRHPVRIARTHEGVQVGVVRQGVPADHGCLPMTGCPHPIGADGSHSHHSQNK